MNKKIIKESWKFTLDERYRWDFTSFDHDAVSDLTLDKEVSHLEFRVYYLIWDYLNEDTGVWIGSEKELINKVDGLTSKKMEDIRKNLVKKGLISIRTDEDVSEFQAYGDYV